MQENILTVYLHCKYQRKALPVKIGRALLSTSREMKKKTIRDCIDDINKALDDLKKENANVSCKEILATMLSC